MTKLDNGVFVSKHNHYVIFISVKKKLLLVSAITVLSLLTLGFSYLISPTKIVAKAVLDNNENFVLQAPYSLDNQGYLKINGLLGLIQYHWASAPPGAMCGSIAFNQGSSYPYTSGRGWPLLYLYQNGECSPPYQLVIISLFLDFLLFFSVYSLMVYSFAVIKRKKLA